METENTTVTTADGDEESFVDLMDLEQSEAVALTLTPKNSTIGVDANVTTTQVCATMRARKLPAEVSRAPVDILVALDVSSSMIGGDKLGLCKLTLELLLRHLLPQDRFGLITYSSNANVEVPLQLMTNKNKDATLQKIKALRANGCTNISAALSLALQELRAVDTPNEVRSVFLLTDGHANTGISDHAGLVELTRNCFASPSLAAADAPGAEPSRRFFGSFFDKKPASQETEKPSAPDGKHSPISMFCFGYGSDHNADMLRDISDATESGSYYHVEQDSDVGSAFGDAMGGILSVVAQSAVLTIRVPEEAHGVEIKEVHHERVIKRENGAYTVNVGDFYAEESRDVLIEVTLAPAHPVDSQAKSDTPLPHLSVSLDYTDILQKKPAQTVSLTCSICRPAGNTVSEEDPHVAAQWLRVVATRAMKTASQFGNQNDLAQARSSLQAAKDQIAAAHIDVQNDFMVIVLVEDLTEAMNGLQSSQEYRERGTHYLSRKRQAYTTQRCNESSATTQSAFRPSYKSQMASKMTLPKK